MDNIQKEKVNVDTTSTTKEKSSIYPAYTVKEIIEDFIKIIDKIGGKKVSLNIIAKTIGVSTGTKSFTRKVSAAKQYNLIEGSQGAVELTELSKKILYPTTSSVDKFLLQAFLNPTIYSKLVERYSGKALPEENVISNILLEPEFGIVKNVKDLVAKKFFENCEDLGIIKSGILCLPDENDDVSNNPMPENSNNTNDGETENNTNKEAQHEDDNSEYETMTIPLLKDKKSVKLLIPKNCDLDDYTFIKQYIETILPMYIERMKK